jgi:hypothetical protein
MLGKCPHRSYRRFSPGDKTLQVGLGVFAFRRVLLAVTHLAGVVFEAVAVLGVFAVDLLTGQVLPRMDQGERNKLAKAG